MAKQARTPPARKPAVRRRVIQDEYLNGFEEPVEPDPIPDDPDDFDFSTLGEDRKLRIEKSIGGAWEYCFHTNSTALDEEQIRAEFGPGSYRVKAFQGNQLIHVGAFRLAPRMGLPNPAEPAAASSESKHFDSIRAMYEGQTRMLTSLLQSFISRDPGEKTPIREILEAAQLLQGSKTDFGPEKIFEILHKGMEIGRDTVGGAKEPESFMSQLLGVAKEAMPMLMSGAQGRPAGSQPALPPAQEEAVQKEFLVKQGIGFLKKKAAVGSDPDLWLGVALESLDEPMYRTIAETLARMTWEDVLKFDPELGGPIYADFFKQFHDGLRSTLQAANSMGANPNGQSGNPGDSPANAKPSKARRTQ